MAQQTQVTNVSFKQSQDLIIVRYDLIGQYNKKFKVDLYLSDNFGTTFSIRPRSVSGDVGKDIHPGRGKEIVWEFIRDYPYLEGEGLVFAVDAEQQKKSSALWIILGGGVIGGGVYLLTQTLGADEPTKGSIKITISGDIGGQP